MSRIAVIGYNFIRAIDTQFAVEVSESRLLYNHAIAFNDTRRNADEILLEYKNKMRIYLLNMLNQIFKGKIKYSTVILNLNKWVVVLGSSMKYNEYRIYIKTRVSL